MMMRAYDGRLLRIAAEIKVGISSPNCSHVAPVLVQEDAPEDLLVGTDFLPHLGLLLVGTAADVDAQGRRQLVVQPAEQPSTLQAPTTTEPPEVRVKLLTATRIPARHDQLVRVCTPEGVEQIPMLEKPLPTEEGLELQPALVHPYEAQTLTLVVRNTTCSPTRLEEGMAIGRLTPIDDWVDLESDVTNQTPPSEHLPQCTDLFCSRVEATPKPPDALGGERLVQLCQELGIDATKVELPWRDQLIALIAE